MPFPRTPEEAQQLINEFHQAYSEHTGTQFRVPSEAVAHALANQALSDEERGAIHAVAAMAGLEPHLAFLKMRDNLARQAHVEYMPLLQPPAPRGPMPPGFEPTPMPPWLENIHTFKELSAVPKNVLLPAAKEFGAGLASGGAISLGASLLGPLAAIPLAGLTLGELGKGAYGVARTALTQGPGAALQQAKTGLEEFGREMFPADNPYALGQTIGGLVGGTIGAKYAPHTPLVGRLYKPRTFGTTTSIQFSEQAPETKPAIKYIKEHYYRAMGEKFMKQPGTKKGPYQNLGVRLVADAADQMQRIPVEIERLSPTGEVVTEPIEVIHYGGKFYNVEGEPVSNIGSIRRQLGEPQPVVREPKDLVLVEEILRRDTGEAIGRVKTGFLGHQIVGRDRTIDLLKQKIKGLSDEAAEELYNELKRGKKQLKVADLLDTVEDINRHMKSKIKGQNPNVLWRQRLTMAEFLEDNLPQIREAARELAMDIIKRNDPEAAKLWGRYAALSEIEVSRARQAVPLGSEAIPTTLRQKLLSMIPSRWRGGGALKAYGQLTDAAERVALKEMGSRGDVKRYLKWARAYPEATEQGEGTKLLPKTYNLDPLIRAFLAASPTIVRTSGATKRTSGVTEAF
jgi:hypothetical protein